MCRLCNWLRGKKLQVSISVKSQHKARRTSDLQCYFVTESFPYVPHTCYLRPGCRPNAGNCARYARLRVCCCDYVTAKKCKYSQLLTIHFSVYSIPLIGTALQPCKQKPNLRNLATATLCTIIPALEITQDAKDRSQRLIAWVITRLMQCH